MALTIKQKIAQKEAELARLKDQNRKLENGQKIIVGSVMIEEALKSPKFAAFLVETLEKKLTRKVDIDRVQSLIQRLKAASTIPSEKETISDI